MRIPLIKKIAGVFNRFVDGKFQNYRGQISNKIAHAGAYLVAFLILWTLFLLFMFFGGIVTGLLIAKLSGSSVLGFSVVTSLAFIVTLAVYLFRNELVVKPVYTALNIAMDGVEEMPLPATPPKKKKKAVEVKLKLKE